MTQPGDRSEKPGFWLVAPATAQLAELLRPSCYGIETVDLSPTDSRGSVRLIIATVPKVLYVEWIDTLLAPGRLTSYGMPERLPWVMRSQELSFSELALVALGVDFPKFRLSCDHRIMRTRQAMACELVAVVLVTRRHRRLTELPEFIQSFGVPVLSDCPEDLWEVDIRRVVYPMVKRCSVIGANWRLLRSYFGGGGAGLLVPGAPCGVDCRPPATSLEN